MIMVTWYPFFFYEEDIIYLDLTESRNQLCKGTEILLRSANSVKDPKESPII